VKKLYSFSTNSLTTKDPFTGTETLPYSVLKEPGEFLLTTKDPFTGTETLVSAWATSASSQIINNEGPLYGDGNLKVTFVNNFILAH